MEKPVFKSDFFQELAEENPLGVTILVEEAEAWWHYIAWPSYKTYAYKLHKRAVRRWWSRLTVTDLARARQAIANAYLESARAAQAYMDACDEEHRGNPYASEDADTLRVIMGGRSGS